MELINNTFFDNQADSEGGAIRILLYEDDNNTALLLNNLIYNNDAPEGADLHLDNDGNNNFIANPIEIKNNNFDQSSSGIFVKLPVVSIDTTNLNNIDPLFVDTINDDYHLERNSPVINMGTNNALSLPTTDLDGNPRISKGIVDMGAYEFIFPNDPPYILKPISDVTYPEDSGTHTIADLDTIFQDSSSQILNYSTISNNNIIIPSINDKILKISTLKDSSGMGLVIISTNDGEFSVSDTFMVTITPVNDSPIVLKSLPNISYVENSGTHIIADLDTVFDDPDGDALIYSSITKENIITSNINNSILTASTIQDFYGVDTVVVTATDGEYSISETFTVTITHINEPPSTFTLLQPINNDTINLNTIDSVSFIWNSSLDTENDMLTYIFTIYEKDTPQYPLQIENGKDTCLSIEKAFFMHPIIYNWTVLVNDGIYQISTKDTFSFFVDYFTSINDFNDQIPKEFSLNQNFPNPFNPRSNIQFNLSKNTHVVLDVFDLSGKKTAKLIDEQMQAGLHSVDFDGSNLSSGIYIYRIQAGEFTAIKKMVLIK